jgi:hypothetical protein
MNMQESIDSTRLGTNRTGMQMSPMLSKEMLDNTDILEADNDGSTSDGRAFSATRLDYIADADPLGTIPPPGTMKGMATSGIKMLTGHRPQAFIDKLSERLAFERGGTRLYDAVIAKFEAHADELSGVSLGDLLRIRNAEAAHAALVRDCLAELGADPTAQTPCADLVGVETIGLLQAASDPRTTLVQTLHTALVAELVDNAGWENLIAFADAMGNKQMADRFGAALLEEQEHLTTVRGWYNKLTLETTELL